MTGDEEADDDAHADADGGDDADADGGDDAGADGGAGDVGVAIDGKPVEAAVDAVVAAEESHDRAFVRSALEAVAEDGVVSASAVERETANAAMALSTAENRRDVAMLEFQGAREAAEPVDHLDVVAARLDVFEAELESIRAAIDDLQARLETVTDATGDPGRLHEAAIGIQRLTADAEALQGNADALRDDLEDFVDWLGDPEGRFEQLETDLDVVDETLDNLSTIVGAIAADASGADGGDGAGANDDAGAEIEVTDPGVAWFDAVLRSRVATLLLADVRAELADLRRWPEDGAGDGGDDGGGDTRDGGDGGDDGGGDTRDETGDADGIDTEARAASVADRIDALGDERDRVAARLDEVSEPAWRDRFDDRIDAFEAELDAMDPPVDWDAVRGALDEHRPTADDAR